MTDLAAVGVGFGVGFIVAHLLHLSCSAAPRRCSDGVLRALGVELREARAHNAALRTQLAAMQQREALAAANIAQLSGALTAAAAPRAAPVQLGANVLDRFSWN